MIKNEKIDIEKLGDEKLDLNIEYPKIGTKKDMRMLNGTIKDFLKGICNCPCSVLYDKRIYAIEMKSLNNNKEKIKHIVDYVANLNKEALAYTNENENNALICDLTRFGRTDEQRYTLNTLEFKKTYIILQLIEWTVNPFEIRRCLKSKGNDDFNWNKFMEYVMDNRELFIIILSGRSSYYHKFYTAMNIIRAMYLFEPLLKNNENESDNLKPFAIDFLLQDLSWLFSCDCHGLHFILNYLNELEGTKQNNEMKEYLLKIPDGYLWKNFLSDSEYYIEDAKKIEERKDTQISLSHLMVDCVRFDFEKKDFEKDGDFWTLISNLNNDPVMISFFMLVAMRRISFTERQMNFIARKIKNQQVIDNLREINRSLDYKIKYINQYGLRRRVKFGPVTAFLDYAFLKMSRGIGYLGAALFDAVLSVPAGLLGGGAVIGWAFLIFPNSTLWTTTFWIVTLTLSVAMALLWMCLFAQMYDYYLRPKFTKFADSMEKFYNDGKIAYWLESHNIKYPTNEIGEPPMEINTGIQSGPVGQGLSEINSNDGPVINTDNDINASLQSK